MLRSTLPSWDRVPDMLEGSVVYADDVSTTIHVLWDDGIELGILPDQDAWEVV